MNNERRKQVGKIVAKLHEALSMLETVAEAEREAFDNMPESFQNSERGEAASTAADTLDEARDNVQSTIDELGNLE